MWGVGAPAGSAGYGHDGWEHNVASYVIDPHMFSTQTLIPVYRETVQAPPVAEALLFTHSTVCFFVRLNYAENKVSEKFLYGATTFSFDIK